MKIVKDLMILTFLLATFMTNTALAADAQGNYAVWGVGQKSCFKYTKARESGDYENYTNYIKGFYTAFNMLHQDTYSITGKLTFTEILDWMDDYCELKQVNALEQGLIEFVGDHEASRLKSSPSRKAGR